MNPPAVCSLGGFGSSLYPVDRIACIQYSAEFGRGNEKGGRVDRDAEWLRVERTSAFKELEQKKKAFI